MNKKSKWLIQALLVSLLMWAVPAWAGGGQGGCKPGAICVPEPTSLALLGVGVGAVLLYRNRRGPKQ